MISNAAQGTHKLVFIKKLAPYFTSFFLFLQLLWILYCERQSAIDQEIQVLRSFSIEIYHFQNTALISANKVSR